MPSDDALPPTVITPASQENETSDSNLLRQYRAGDENAATELYVRYAHRLRAMARGNVAPDLAPRLDPDDIVQSVFRSFFKGVNLGYYDVPEGEELWKLFLIITLNKIRAQGARHRAARRDVRRTSSAEVIDAFLDSDSAQDNEALTVLRLVIDDVLVQLPAHGRTIIELRIQGHDVAEIAGKIGRSKRTVERNLQEFRKKLAKLLESEEG